MSVVIAVKDGDRILMGGDCQVSCGGSKAILVSPNLMKVWNVERHPNTLMGGVGALRDLNIAYSMDKLYDSLRDKAGETLDFKYVVNEVVPTILNHFTSHGRATNDKGIVAMQSAFILAQKDKCFSIDFDGCVIDMTYDGECMAIGSGATKAQAAYNTLATIEGLSAEDKLLKALIQACEDDLHVNFPVYIRDTEDTSKLIVFDGVDTYVIGDDEEEVEELPMEKEEE